MSLLWCMLQWKHYHGPQAHSQTLLFGCITMSYTHLVSSLQEYLRSHWVQTPAEQRCSTLCPLFPAAACSWSVGEAIMDCIHTILQKRPMSRKHFHTIEDGKCKAWQTWKDKVCCMSSCKLLTCIIACTPESRKHVCLVREFEPHRVASSSRKPPRDFMYHIKETPSHNHTSCISDIHLESIDKPIGLAVCWYIVSSEPMS